MRQKGPKIRPAFHPNEASVREHKNTAAYKIQPGVINVATTFSGNHVG